MGRLLLLVLLLLAPAWGQDLAAQEKRVQDLEAQAARARALAARAPATYIAFDLLRLDGADVTALPWTQRRALLEQLAPFVRPGGRLVYSVCSLEPEEGTAIVERFVSQHAEFRALPAPAWAEEFSSGRYLATLPERDGGDGFFAARLRRQL